MNYAILHFVQFMLELFVIIRVYISKSTQHTNYFLKPLESVLISHKPFITVINNCDQTQSTLRNWKITCKYMHINREDEIFIVILLIYVFKFIMFLLLIAYITYFHIAKVD